MTDAVHPEVLVTPDCWPHTWFVLTQLLGYPQVRPYAASWNEWGRLPDTPVTQAARAS